MTAAEATRPYGFTALQVAEMLRPIIPDRVHSSQGHSHVAAYDVIAELNFLFGFDGWDKTIVSLEKVFEDQTETTKANGQKRIGWTVCYRCVLRLTVRDPHGNVVKVSEDVATGAANNLPSRGDAHDFACKNAVSYAVKRAAKDLGDQFGLSLYNKGMLAACVGETLVTRDAGTQAAAASDRVVPRVESLGNDEIEYVEPDPDPDAEVTTVTQPAAAPDAPAEPAEPLPDPYWLEAWLRCYERLPQVIGADGVSEFQAWGRAQGYRSQARTATELDALVGKARDMVTAAQPAHQWDPADLERIQSALAEMCDDQSPLARERDVFEAFAFDEFADPFHPETWTEDQYLKLSPILFGFGDSPATSSEDPVDDPTPTPAPDPVPV